ncbi:MAG: TrkA family potassium uptake protein [Planctomycetota bacterium]
MKIAIVGMGLFGQALALQLARSGAEVIVVDTNIQLITNLRDEVALAVCMDATDEREFAAQGLARVDVLVACIGNDFEANQLVVMLAKQQGVPRVIARAPSQRHEKILTVLGADEVLLPEVRAGESLGRRLMSGETAH